MGIGHNISKIFDKLGNTAKIKKYDFFGMNLKNLFKESVKLNKELQLNKNTTLKVYNFNKELDLQKKCVSYENQIANSEGRIIELKEEIELNKIAFDNNIEDKSEELIKNEKKKLETKNFKSDVKISKEEEKIKKLQKKLKKSKEVILSNKIFMKITENNVMEFSDEMMDEVVVIEKNVDDEKIENILFKSYWSCWDDYEEYFHHNTFINDKPMFDKDPKINEELKNNLKTFHRLFKEEQKTGIKRTSFEY